MIVRGLVRGEEVGQRSETVRRANLSSIVRELHERGPLTRSELVARTGLTRSAIRGLIGELTAAGLVTEERSTGHGMPGRPSPVVRLSPRRAVALALEIDVDTLAAAAVGLGGEILDRRRIDRPSGHVSVEAIADDLVELAEELGDGDWTRASLVGVGVGVVGVTRRSDGLVSMAPNLGWRDAPLGDALVERLNVPVAVSVANEADLGALAEHRRGAAIGSRNVVFIHGEVGVGGGLIVDGKPLTGAAGYGGEIGHIPVNPAGVACRCGSVGCWETEVGAWALLRRAGHPPGGGRRDVDAVIREAEDGSPVALAALEEVGRWLGIGLAGLINTLNPEVIVLGGLFGRIQPYTGQALESALDRMALSAPRRLVRIVPTRLGVDAPLIGAAEYAFEPLLADPAAWLAPRGELVELASA
ncbi:MAG TPA: ROK family protein [Candidatus Limnocylindrales bacterium]|nr:ROK family protein [Candidatus Limnocylindrales bacterium]